MPARPGFALLLGFLGGCADVPSSLGTANQRLAEADPSDQPAVVAVSTEVGLSSRLCTGVVIAPGLILTARHCLSFTDWSLETASCDTTTLPLPSADVRITVIPGSDMDLVAPELERSVREIWMPENAGWLCGEDLALLLLDGPLPFAPLPISAEPFGHPMSALSPGTAFTAVGYGLADGDYGQQRMTGQASVTCVGEACHNPQIDEREFLGESGACEGDSGGPAIDDFGAVFGIVSRTSGDCSSTAYLSLAPHFSWLAQSARAAAEFAAEPYPSWAEPAEAVTATPSTTEEPAEASSPEPPTLHAHGGCSMAFPARSSILGWLVLLGAWLASHKRHRATAPQRH